MTLFHKKINELERALSELRPDKKPEQIKKEAFRVVATGCGVAALTISRWYENPKAITGKSIGRLENYFKVTFSELLSEI